MILDQREEIKICHAVWHFKGLIRSPFCEIPDFDKAKTEIFIYGTSSKNKLRNVVLLALLPTLPHPTLPNRSKEEVKEHKKKEKCGGGGIVGALVFKSTTKLLL